MRDVEADRLPHDRVRFVDVGLHRDGGIDPPGQEPPCRLEAAVGAIEPVGQRHPVGIGSHGGGCQLPHQPADAAGIGQEFDVALRRDDDRGRPDEIGLRRRDPPADATAVVVE